MSASPKPHPSKPHPCNMPQAKTEVALQFSECCAAEVALQHSLFCSADVILTTSCTATNEKLHRNIEKAALQESGAFLPLSCRFQAPTFRHPRLGPADNVMASDCRAHFGCPSARRGCRICVTVRLPVRPRGETMHWQANTNTPPFQYPPFNLPER